MKENMGKHVGSRILKASPHWASLIGIPPLLGDTAICVFSIVLSSALLYQVSYKNPTKKALMPTL